MTDKRVKEIVERATVEVWWPEQLVRFVAAETRKDVLEMARDLAYEVMGGSLNLASSYVERLYSAAQRLKEKK